MCINDLKMKEKIIIKRGQNILKLFLSQEDIIN